MRQLTEAGVPDEDVSTLNGASKSLRSLVRDAKPDRLLEDGDALWIARATPRGRRE